jgi:hypothetical protein
LRSSHSRCVRKEWLSLVSQLLLVCVSDPRRENL